MTRGAALAGTALVLAGSLGLQGAVTPAVAQTQASPPGLPGAYPGPDSMTAAPGEGYSAGPLRRLLLGALRRDLWALPVTLPVLDLDSVDGGLTLARIEEGEAPPAVVFAGRGTGPCSPASNARRTRA